MSEHVSYEFSDDTAIIRLDDGKVNAISMSLIAEINGALDRTEQDGAKAIAIVGREGKFSGGFDLNVMRGGLEGMIELLRTGANLALRMYSLPVSLVFGVTGHCLAMGAIFALAADERIGAAGNFKLGLNEVAIGMAMPMFGVVLAQDRLDPRYIYRALCSAELFDPEGAVNAGYLDRIVAAEETADAAIARAKEMAATLHPGALKETKLRMRADKIAKLQVILSDMNFGLQG